MTNFHFVASHFDLNLSGNYLRSRRNFVDISKIEQQPLGFIIWPFLPKWPKLVKSRNWTNKTNYKDQISNAQLYSSHQFSRLRNTFAAILENNQKVLGPKWNLPFLWGEMAQNASKMGKINVFQKLQWLECLFLFISPHFPPTESIYNSFKHSQLLVTLKLGPRGCKIGPKTIQNG